MTQYFREGIEEMAEHNGLTYEETLEQLKQHYDGYHFSINSEDIFNPYSIINALDDKEFNSYWFTSGTPTFLIELMQQKNLDMMDLNDIWARAKRFDVPTETITDPVPVLFQSGYLTIKDMTSCWVCITSVFLIKKLDKAFRKVFANIIPLQR